MMDANFPVTLAVKRLTPTARMPVFATAGAACFDLFADEVDDAAQRDRVQVYDLQPRRFRTGLAFEVPFGYVMLIFSRSGHGFNFGVRLANCVGVIDSDYRGEVMVKLTADERKAMEVRVGDRIAQALILPIPRIEFVEADALSETARGAGGLGSTGA